MVYWWATMVMANEEALSAWMTRVWEAWCYAEFERAIALIEQKP
jgi:hypothetical protein